MAPQPVVTGLSPKEGPPGTRIIIRGEFLGSKATDLIGLKICGFDCLLAAEWVSPNKIIARSGPSKGLGDIIVTTQSGGKGSSAVQFRSIVHHETIGPLKESAVWIDEAPNQNFAWGRRTLVQSGLTPDDPLGLSTEGNEKKNVENLRELFPNASGDLSQENFLPALFLLENHSTTSFADLKAGLNYLNRKVESQKEGQLSFLKTNAGSVIDQLDTLINIRDKLQEDQEQFDQDPLDLLEKEIEDSIKKSENIFTNVLLCKEKADLTRALLLALSRHRFLFCLPKTIETHAVAGEYDIVVNDYARAQSRFGKTELPIFRKVMEEVDLRIIEVRKQLHENVVKMPQSVDQQRNLIKALTSLEVQQQTGGNFLISSSFNEKLRNIDPAWNAIEARAKYLEQCFKQTFEVYANKEVQGAAEKNKTARDSNQLPYRVLFYEEICETAAAQLPDLWKLGQMYFTGELRGPSDPRPGDFKRMILSAIETFCVYLKITLCSTDAESRVMRQTLGFTWPIIAGTAHSNYEIFRSWLAQCLQYTRTTYATLISLDLPSTALDIVQKFIDEVRLHCFSYIFERATQKCNKLRDRENWEMDVEEFAGATRLPQLMEDLLIETLTEAEQSCVNPEIREGNLMESESDGQREVSQRLQKFLLCFCDVIQDLAFNSHKEETPTHNVSQLLGYPNIVVPQQQNHHQLQMQCEHDLCATGSEHFGRNISSHITWEQRMLCCLANCAYCHKSFFHRVGNLFEKYGYPLPSLAIETARYSVYKLFSNILDAYVEHKGDPLVGTIEPSMYLGGFRWDMLMPIGQLRPYAHECCDNIVAVFSEIYTISPALLRPILEPIVLTIAEELARLMSCVSDFSVSGAIQANVDIRLLRDSLKVYTNETGRNYFFEALDAINPPLNVDQMQQADSILEKVKDNMRLQLLCFTVRDP